MCLIYKGSEFGQILMEEMKLFSCWKENTSTYVLFFTVQFCYMLMCLLMPFLHLTTKLFLCLIQSYIQSFRDRQVQAQPFPGRLVGGPNAVVDVGYDCGSTTPLTGAPGPSLRVWPLLHLPEAWTPHNQGDTVHDSTITSPPGCDHICASKSPLGLNAKILGSNIIWV